MGLQIGLYSGGLRRCAMGVMVSHGCTTQCDFQYQVRSLYKKGTYRWKLSIYVIREQSAKLRQILGL